MNTQQEILLDELDFAILTQLQKNGRKSFSDIARDLNVAVNTVRNRVARMVENGTLTIIGRVNPLHAGFQAYASIFIAVEPSTRIDEVAHRLSEFPETSFVCMTSGDFDLWIDVMCLDNNHLTELLTHRVQTIPGVVKTKTIFILKVYKYGQPDLGALRHQSQDAETESLSRTFEAVDAEHLPYR